MRHSQTQEDHAAGWEAWGHCAYVPRDCGPRGRACHPPQCLILLACAGQVDGNVLFELQCPNEPTADHPAPLLGLVSSGRWTSGGVCSTGCSFLPIEAHLTAIFLGILKTSGALKLLFLTCWVVVDLFGFKYILCSLLELCEWERR